MVKTIYLVYVFNSIEDYNRQKIIYHSSISDLMFLIHSMYWDLKSNNQTRDYELIQDDKSSLRLWYFNMCFTILSYDLST